MVYPEFVSMFFRCKSEVIYLTKDSGNRSSNSKPNIISWVQFMWTIIIRKGLMIFDSSTLVLPFCSVVIKLV